MHGEGQHPATPKLGPLGRPMPDLGAQLADFMLARARGAKVQDLARHFGLSITGVAELLVQHGDPQRILAPAVKGEEPPRDLPVYALREPENMDEIIARGRQVLPPGDRD